MPFHVVIAFLIVIIAVIYIAVFQQKKKEEEKEKKRVEDKKRKLIEILERTGMSEDPRIAQLFEEDFSEARIDELLDGFDFIFEIFRHLGGLYSKKESLHEEMLKLIRLQVVIRLKLYRSGAKPISINLRKFLRMFRRTLDKEDTINMTYRFA